MDRTPLSTARIAAVRWPAAASASARERLAPRAPYLLRRRPTWLAQLRALVARWRSAGIPHPYPPLRMALPDTGDHIIVSEWNQGGKTVIIFGRVRSVLLAPGCTAHPGCFVVQSLVRGQLVVGHAPP